MDLDLNGYVERLERTCSALFVENMRLSEALAQVSGDQEGKEIDPEQVQPEWEQFEGDDNG